VNPWKNKLIWLLVSLYSAAVIAGPGLHFVPGVSGCSSHCSVIHLDSDGSKSHCEDSCPFDKHAATQQLQQEQCQQEQQPVARGVHNHDDCAVCKLLATLSHSLLVDFQLEQVERSVIVSSETLNAADRFSFGLFQSRAPPSYF